MIEDAPGPPEARELATTGEPEAPAAPEKMPREVVVLGWVSFFADVSSEMIYPLLPLFVVGVLGASGSSLGWVEGVAMAVVAVLTALAGWRSDRIRRRVPYVRIGYALPIAGKTIIAAATTWPLILVGRTVDRIGKGIRASPRDALIADHTPPALRGRAFGLHRAMDTAGALTGVLLSAALLFTFSTSRASWAFRLVFIVAAALSVAAFALTLLLREPPHPRPLPAATTPAAPAPLPRTYWAVVALLLLFSFANSSDAFLLLRAADVGLEPWQVVAAYALYNLVYAAGSYPAGAVADRLGKWRVIGAGWAVYALIYAGFALAAPATIWPLFALYGVYAALTDGVSKALVADHAPRDRRGFALGIYYMCSGGTALVASVTAGVLWDRVGHAAPFWLGAAAAAVALAALLVLRPRLRPPAPSADAPRGTATAAAPTGTRAP